MPEDNKPHAPPAAAVGPGACVAVRGTLSLPLPSNRAPRPPLLPAAANCGNHGKVRPQTHHDRMAFTRSKGGQTPPTGPLWKAPAVSGVAQLTAKLQPVPPPSEPHIGVLALAAQLWRPGVPKPPTQGPRAGLRPGPEVAGTNEWRLAPEVCPCTHVTLPPTAPAAAGSVEVELVQRLAALPPAMLGMDPLWQKAPGTVGTAPSKWIHT